LTGGDAWAQESERFLADLDSPIRVLVWGPGETSRKAWFEKRAEVVRELKDALSSEDEVYTSEEIFERQDSAPIEAGYAELAHVAEADLVIALVLASPSRQGGVYRELEILVPYEWLRRKVLIFLPSNKSYLKRFQAGMLDMYRDDQKISMSWSVLKECQKLRKLCVARVMEERKRRRYEVFSARLRAQGLS
jgi:hypothetical protein